MSRNLIPLVFYYERHRFLTFFQEACLLSTWISVSKENPVLFRSFPLTNLVVDTELDNRTFDCPLACLNALRSTVNRKFHFIKIFLHRLKLQVLKACTNIIYSTVTSNLEIESFNPLNTMKKENLINRDRKRTKSTDEGFSNE